MSVDKSAVLLYAVVVCVTISRSTNENTMDDNDDARQHRMHGEVSSRSPVLRQRPRSASIGHLSSVSTPVHSSETADDRKHRFHVASFDFSYVSTPFVVSLWIVLASIAKIGPLISAVWLNSDGYILYLFIHNLLLNPTRHRTNSPHKLDTWIQATRHRR